MQTNHAKLLREHELTKYEDFFYIFYELFNGVMLRKHIQMLFPTTYKSRLKDWLNCQLVKKMEFAGNVLIVQRYSKSLGLLRQREYSRDKLVRSAMRFEYYFNVLGLQTAQEIRGYSDKGNDRINHEGLTTALLAAYDAALKSRGISLPMLSSVENAKSLYNLTLRNVFISKVTIANGAVVPHIIFYSCRGQAPQEIAKEVLRSYRAIMDIFYDPSGKTEVCPFITICRFEGMTKQDKFYRQLEKAPEFLTTDREVLQLMFSIVEVARPFRYIDYTQIV